MVTNQVELKSFNQPDFSQEEIEDILLNDLDIFELKKPVKATKRAISTKNKENVSKNDSKVEESKVSHPKLYLDDIRDKVGERGYKVFQGTVDYIMNETEYIPVDEFQEVLGKSLFELILKLFRSIPQETKTLYGSPLQHKTAHERASVYPNGELRSLQAI